MRRLLFFPAVLVSLATLDSAVAEPLSPPATAAALHSAAFAGRTEARERGGGAEQKLAFGRTGPFYLYAAASNSTQQLQEDPRWRADHETRSANTLVNTRFGIGWERDETHISFGYLRRQLPNPGGALRDKPRRDSMVGLAVSIHPNF
jgi:hypothetical protein